MKMKSEEEVNWIGDGSEKYEDKENIKDRKDERWGRRKICIQPYLASCCYWKRNEKIGKKPIDYPGQCCKAEMRTGVLPTGFALVFSTQPPKFGCHTGSNFSQAQYFVSWHFNARFLSQSLGGCLLVIEISQKPVRISR